VTNYAAERKRRLDRDPLCAACRAQATNTHHLISKAQLGPDRYENLVPLCGDGASGCHGALHGSSYIKNGERVTAKDVRTAIGQWVLRHPEVLVFLGSWLGEDKTRAILTRNYHLDLDAR
jgi:hypothetical protein